MAILKELLCLNHVRLEPEIQTLRKLLGLHWDALHPQGQAVGTGQQVMTPDGFMATCKRASPPPTL